MPYFRIAKRSTQKDQLKKDCVALKRCVALILAGGLSFLSSSPAALSIPHFRLTDFPSLSLTHFPILGRRGGGGKPIFAKCPAAQHHIPFPSAALLLIPLPAKVLQQQLPPPTPLSNDDEGGREEAGKSRVRRRGGKWGAL